MGQNIKTPKKKRSKETPPPIPWTTPETRGFLILSTGILIFLSLLSFATAPDAKNLIGLIGHTLGWAGHALFGLSSYLLILYLMWVGWRLLSSRPLDFLWLKNIYVLIAVGSFSVLLSLAENQWDGFAENIGAFFYPGIWIKKQKYHLGGAPFFYLYQDLPVFNFNRVLNTAGIGLIFSTTLCSSLLFLFQIRPFDGMRKVLAAWKNSKAALQPVHPAVAEEPKKQTEIKPESDFLRFVKLRIPSFSLSETSGKTQSPPHSDMLEIQPEQNPKERPSISRKGIGEGRPALSSKEPFGGLTAPSLETEFPHPVKKPILEKDPKKEPPLLTQEALKGDFSKYVLPSPSILTNAKKMDQSSLKKDLKKQAEVLEETLLSFGIEAKVGQINCGPTITSFEVHPAIGVKVQKIKTLGDDIALNMEAKSIRILAPIPGKAAVGIEVPNAHPQEVGFKEMLLAYQQGSHKFHIPILLGKAVNGDYVMSDLTKMPHCIIAGATGSGKSVCINTIIVSILLNSKPDQIKLLMVDPKKVELTPYTRLPHMLAPVITEPQGAAAALKWLVKEMEQRYETLKLIGVRNIEAFNNRKVDPALESTLDREIPATMPFIVCIIDELADLMMVASQDIETPIARIAQMARAVGIHMILATQRPSREVITGLIKANFPTRIAFKVASRVNSQIILDDIGAESLLGNGDMLFLPPGSSHLTRAQGAFVRDEDIQGIVREICTQSPPNYLIQSFDRPDFEEIAVNGGAPPNLDALYKEAKDIVLSTGNASTTFLQRKLKVGYARAASLMDQLEMQGVVGPAEGSRPRKIFGAKAGASIETDDGDGLEEE